jgi:predicted dehydrogenase
MPKRKVNVAMIGYDFMGRTHSNAWRQVGRFFQEPAVRSRAEGGRRPHGGQGERCGGALSAFEEHATSWQGRASRARTSTVRHLHAGDSHPPIAIAAAEAGKAICARAPRQHPSPTPSG